MTSDDLINGILYLESKLDRKIMKIVIGEGNLVTELLFEPDYNKITADLIKQAVETESKIF